MKSVCWSSSALLNPNGSSKNCPLCKEWLWRTAAAPSRLLTFHQMRAINRCWTELESKTGSRVGYFGEPLMVQLLALHSWDDFVKFHQDVAKVHMRMNCFTRGLSRWRVWGQRPNIHAYLFAGTDVVTTVHTRGSQQGGAILFFFNLLFLEAYINDLKHDLEVV